MTRRAPQKVPQKEKVLTIRVVRRSDDFHACLDDQPGVWGPGVWGCGRSVNEAVGELVRSHTETFGIKLTLGVDQVPSLPESDERRLSRGMDPTPVIGRTGLSGPWTADTITDAQIRELFESGSLSAGESADCTHALQKRDRHWTRFQRSMQRSARARCAQIFNAHATRSP